MCLLYSFTSISLLSLSFSLYTYIEPQHSFRRFAAFATGSSPRRLFSRFMFVRWICIKIGRNCSSRDSRPSIVLFYLFIYCFFFFLFPCKLFLGEKRIDGDGGGDAILEDTAVPPKWFHLRTPVVSFFQGCRYDSRSPGLVKSCWWTTRCGHGWRIIGDHRDPVH